MRDDRDVAAGSDIAARIRAAIAELCDVEAARLRPETSLYDDLGADSLAVMEMLGGLEDELGIQLPDSNEFAIRLRTVGDVVGAFESRAP
jgi:acyl carrier protein